MLGFLVRLAGLVIFGASFITLVSDGIRTLAANHFVLTPLGQTWYDFDRRSLALVQGMVERYVHPYIWDPVLQTVLSWPTFAVGGVVGILLMALGSGRRRTRP
jgi:hypothetical protein